MSQHLVVLGQHCAPPAEQVQGARGPDQDLVHYDWSTYPSNIKDETSEMRDPQHHHHQTLAQAEGHDNTVGDQMDRMVGLAMSHSHEISYEMFISCCATPFR